MIEIEVNINNGYKFYVDDKGNFLYKYKSDFMFLDTIINSILNHMIDSNKQIFRD